MEHKSVAPLALLALFAFAPACSDSVQVRAVSPYNTSLGMSGIRLRANEGEWVTTDRDGYAVFEGLSTPFDLDIEQAHDTTGHNSAFPDGYAVRFRDLWRLVAVDSSDYEVKVDEYPGLEDPTCVVTGHVDMTAGDKVVFDISHLGAGRGNWATTEPDFEADLSTELRTDEVGVYAMAGDFPNSGFPTRVTAAGRIDVQIPGGKCGTLSNVDVPLSPVTTRALDLTYAAPAGFEVRRAGAAVRLRFDDHPEAVLGVGAEYVEEAQATISGLVVDGFGDPWASAWVVGPGRVVDGDAQSQWPWDYFEVYGAFTEVDVRVPGSASSLTFDLPTPAELLAPEDGVSLVEGTVYRWSAVPGATRYTLNFGCTPLGRPGGSVVANVETSATELTLPAFVYAAIEPGMRCGWSVLVRDEAEGRSIRTTSAERWGIIPE